jgi:hypothetical protein
MLVNTFPLSNDQPVPNFIKNFWSDVKNYIADDAKQARILLVGLDAVIQEMLNAESLNGFVKIRTANFEEIDEFAKQTYIIIAWEDESDRLAFACYYDPSIMENIYAFS